MQTWKAICRVLITVFTMTRCNSVAPSTCKGSAGYILRRMNNVTHQRQYNVKSVTHMPSMNPTGQELTAQMETEIIQIFTETSCRGTMQKRTRSPIQTCIANPKRKTGLDKVHQNASVEPSRTNNAIGQAKTTHIHFDAELLNKQLLHGLHQDTVLRIQCLRKRRREIGFDMSFHLAETDLHLATKLAEFLCNCNPRLINPFTQTRDLFLHLGKLVLMQTQCLSDRPLSTR